MSFDPHAWGWPQWTMAVTFILGLFVAAVEHGKPRVGSDGKPHNYNFFVALVRVGIWTFCLISGGFFGTHP